MIDTPLTVEFFKRLIAQGTALSVIGGGIYWLLQKKPENRFTIEVERAKNQLQLEHAKLSIVYEHQKDSFRKVLAAMNTVMEAIEDEIESAGGPWGAIDSKVNERFRHTISKELLFLDGRAEHALEIFGFTTLDAVSDPRYDSYAESDDVSRAYEISSSYRIVSLNIFASLSGLPRRQLMTLYTTWRFWQLASSSQLGVIGQIGRLAAIKGRQSNL